MKVHVITTADYAVNRYDSVLKELDGIEGPISFKGHEPIEDCFPNRESHENFVFFDHCKRFRAHKNIAADEFVVFLTTVDNKDEWFSRFEKKNIFIYCTEWSRMGDVSVYPITYEIFANVIQSLMKLKLNPTNELLHEPPIGCMNDLCTDTSNIMLKLRTGDICKDCIKALTKKVDVRTLDQVLEAFDKIRARLLSRQGFVRRPSTIVFDGPSIQFPGFGTEIETGQLRKALYKYILINQPIHTADFNFDDLLGIYVTYNPAGELTKHRRTIRNLLVSGTFDSNLSCLNLAIKSAVGRQLFERYEIKKRVDGYSCNLPAKKIIIE